MGQRADVIKRALPLILAATGGSAGALYLRRGEDLNLVSHSGMPTDMRRHLKRLSSGGPTWFTAQRAAMSRGLTHDTQLARRCAAHIAPDVLSAAGWEQAAAHPIIADGELLGVVMIASPTTQDIRPDALLALELAANTLALHLAAAHKPADESCTDMPAQAGEPPVVKELVKDTEAVKASILAGLRYASLH